MAGDALNDIRADGKHVVVIGGGDTGSDCVGTSNRHGAVSVTQFELLPQPPDEENKPLVWPYWPIKLRTSSSHDEGCSRDWAVATKEFIGENGKVKALKALPRGVEGRPACRKCRAASSYCRPTWCCWPWASPTPVGSVLEAFGVDTDARKNARASTEGDQRVLHQRAQGVRRRRRAPRPVARGVGHPRRPPVPPARSTPS